MLGFPWSTDGQFAWHLGHPEPGSQEVFFVGGQGLETTTDTPIYDPGEHNLEP